MADEENKQPELEINRKPWRQRLIEDVTHFHNETGMEFSTIGMKAIGNGRFWNRLQEGGTIGIDKADELYFWMAAKGYHFNS